MTTAPATKQPLADELRSAVQRVERRAYTQGWAYGVVCGLLAGTSTTGLAIWLVTLWSASWAP